MLSDAVQIIYFLPGTDKYTKREAHRKKKTKQKQTKNGSTIVPSQSFYMIHYGSFSKKYSKDQATVIEFSRMINNTWKNYKVP